jgi:hypothetical protein
MRKCANFSVRKPFLKYDFAPDPIWISLYMRNILFSFLSVYLLNKVLKEQAHNPVCSWSDAFRPKRLTMSDRVLVQNTINFQISCLINDLLLCRFHLQLYASNSKGKDTHIWHIKQSSLITQVNYFKHYFQDPPLICRRIMQTDGNKSLISSKILVTYSQSKRMRWN